MIKDIGTKITEGLDKFYKAFQKQRVLKTMEEVEANTDEKNLASALLLSELNNNLGGARFGLTEDGTPGWKDGADTVHPFIKNKLILTQFATGSINSGSYPYYYDNYGCSKVILDKISGNNYKFSVYGYENGTYILLASAYDHFEVDISKYAKIRINVPIGSYGSRGEFAIRAE